MLVLYYFVFFLDIIQYLDRLIANATGMMFGDGFAHFLCCFACCCLKFYLFCRSLDSARSASFVNKKLLEHERRVVGAKSPPVITVNPIKTIKFKF